MSQARSGSRREFCPQYGPCTQYKASLWLLSFLPKAVATREGTPYRMWSRKPWAGNSWGREPASQPAGACSQERTDVAGIFASSSGEGQGSELSCAPGIQRTPTPVCGLCRVHMASFPWLCLKHQCTKEGNCPTSLSALAKLHTPKKLDRLTYLLLV